MNHHQSLELVNEVIVLTCTCGYQEIIGWKCTVGLVVALSEAHKASYLIEAMETLGVKE